MQPQSSPFVVPASRHEFHESFLAARERVHVRPADKNESGGFAQVVLATLLACFLVGGGTVLLAGFIRGRPQQPRPAVGRRVATRDRSPARRPLPEPAWDPFATPVHEECEIEWFRGYVKSQFVFIAGRSASSYVRESPWFGWRGPTPPPQDYRSAAARDQLLQVLLRDGWERCGVGTQWYSDRLERTVYQWAVDA